MRKTDINNLSQLFVEKVAVSKEKMDIGEVKPIKGGPPSDIDTPEEYENFANSKSKKMNLKEDNNMLPKSTFDDLFKSTINEQDEMMDDEMMEDDEFDLEGEDSLDTEETEEVDIGTRLEMIIDDLNTVLAEIRGDVEEEVGMEEDDEFDLDDDSMSEAKSEPEPKPHSDSGGKALMGKSNKVPGSGHSATGGSATGGSIKHSPEPQPMSDKKGAMMGKSMKASSKVTQGKDMFHV
jgi:hypothetical protein